MTKTKQDNHITNHIDMFYVKTKTELSGLIWPSVVYDENQWTSCVGAFYIEKNIELSWPIKLDVVYDEN